MAEKVLVADDDEDIVFMLKSMLEKNGYEVVTAADGEQALRVLRTQTPDLMIVDLTMPNMSGWNFTTKVRQNERFKNTPIIVLSGLLENQREPEVFESASIYMPKPFDIFEVLKKVQDLLKQH